MRFHEDPALGRADPPRLDEFTGSLPASAPQGSCSKGPKASNFIESYKGTALRRCASTKIRHWAGPTPHVWMSSPGPYQLRHPKVRAQKAQKHRILSNLTKALPSDDALPRRSGIGQGRPRTSG